MFKKLDVDFGNISENFGTVKKTYQNGTFTEYDISNIDGVLEYVNTRIKFRIQPDRINLTSIAYPGAEPHTDVYSVALNYYVNSPIAKTIFWNSDIGNINTRLSVNKVRQLQLEYACSFEAQAGDAYLLDTHIIHSVEIKPAENVDRVILRFLWKKHQFEEIFNSIEIL